MRVQPVVVQEFQGQGVGQVSELAWAAGFFDGEGHVGCCIHRSKTQNDFKRLTLTIAQVDRQVLDRFQQAVGVGTVNGPYEHGKNRTRYFIYQGSTTSHVLEIHKLLEPFLSTVKQEQFINALAEFSEFRTGEHERHVAAGKYAMTVRWGTKAGGIEDVA